MNVVNKLAALTLGVTFGAAAHAEILTFSDLTPTNQPQIWHGFDITPGIDVVDGSTSLTPLPYGTKALRGDAQYTPVLHALAPFTFSGADISPAAFNEWWDLSATDVRFVGYLDGVQVAAETVSIIHYLAPDVPDRSYRWYDIGGSFANQQIDALAIYPDGLVWSQGSYWSIDALNISPVPEPETWALMGLGLVGLIAGRRKAGKA
ncbi:PEP-CTERM sorting domain-containing protein [Amantichitinum ursilacus]|uniref:PEP-CTERM motif protein n=1 Tax=Amantichitinum ursilacus TaxID=857265 RepID=A0A0N0GQK3_9NEIS|nr:PEP-CTERM sorting domain-containing protein [Amantichitinum ursilacus]KPC54541.1 PEP-CTERM motif protein [Amantichitinum ursilacus]